MRFSTSFLRQTLLLIGIPLAASFAVAGDAGPHPVAVGSEVPADAPYLAENNTAMTKMMTAMAARPTGRCRSRFCRDDGSSPSGRNRHGGRDSAVWQQ